MDEFIIRILFLIAGLGFGWGLGMLHSTMHYAKRTRENTEYCRAVLQRTLDNAAHPVLNTEPREDIVEGESRTRDERGAANLTSVGMGVALLVVIFSLFSTLQTNSRVADTQDQIVTNADTRGRENVCTATILFATVDALNQRTTYTTDQVTSNIELQNKQLKFLSSLDSGKPLASDALDDYIKALSRYIKVTAQDRATAKENPYPTQQGYAVCLRKARMVPGDE